MLQDEEKSHVPVADLDGPLLSLWVAHALKLERPRIAFDIVRVGSFEAPVDFAPHEYWAQGGPLIEKYRIQLEAMAAPVLWRAEIFVRNHQRILGGRWIIDDGDTPLQAICRVVVRAAFGETVPDEVPHA